MKKYAVITVVACIAFITMAAFPGYAQVLIKADVPFDFSAGYGVLPAGEYSIAPTAWGVGRQSLLLSSGIRGLEIVIPKTIESRMDVNGAKLIFHRYGSEYFLAEMWTSADGVVRTFPVHPRERKLLAKAGLTPEVAVVYGVSPSRAGN
jgi:hypothetical protein